MTIPYPKDSKIIQIIESELISDDDVCRCDSCDVILNIEDMLCEDCKIRRMCMRRGCNRRIGSYVWFGWSDSRRRYVEPCHVRQCDVHCEYKGTIHTFNNTKTFIIDRTETDFRKNGKISSIMNFRAGHGWDNSPNMVVRTSSWEQACVLIQKYPSHKEIDSIVKLYCSTYYCKFDNAYPIDNVIIYNQDDKNFYECESCNGCYNERLKNYPKIDVIQKQKIINDPIYLKTWINECKEDTFFEFSNKQERDAFLYSRNK